MASIINASSTGSGGIVQTADASGVLQLQSNGTVALAVSGATTAFSGNIKSSQSAGTGARYTVYQDATNWSYIDYGADAITRWITGNNSGGTSSQLSLGSTSSVNGSFTEKFQFASNGNFSIQVANAGITFNNSSSIGGTTLNDYESGTWTPTVGGTATYSSQTGTYTKIGRFVCCEFDLLISSIGTGSVGSISGLPFTSTGTTNGKGGSVGYFSGLANNFVFVTLRIDSNSNTIGLANLTAANSVLSTSATLQTNSRLLGSISYNANF
jgi:hypothetical protein